LDLNPSPTIQLWQECWCPSPSKRLTSQQDLSSSQEGRDVLGNKQLLWPYKKPVKGQTRKRRKKEKKTQIKRGKSREQKNPK